MYIEFIIGYILTGILAALLIVVIVLQSIILKKISHNGYYLRDSSLHLDSDSQKHLTDHDIAVCENCAARFDPKLSICPKCGTPR